MNAADKLSKEVLRLYQLPDDSKLVKDHRRDVQDFHTRYEENLGKVKTKFDRKSGRYRIQISGGETDQSFRGLVLQCLDGSGFIRPLHDATGSGGGAGGPAAAEPPNALFNGVPSTIVFRPDGSTGDDTSTDDDDTRIDVDAILHAAFQRRDGMLELTFDNGKYATACYARKRAMELGVPFNTAPEQAPDWYNALMGLEVQQGLLKDLKALEQKREGTHVDSYNVDKSPEFLALQGSMTDTLVEWNLKRRVQFGQETTEAREMRLATKAVEDDLKEDELVDLFEPLTCDRYMLQFRKRFSFFKCVVKPAKPESTSAVQQNPRIILTPKTNLKKRQMVSLAQKLQKKLNRDGLPAEIKVYGRRRRKGMALRGDPSVVVTPEIAMNLEPILKWLLSDENLKWLQPLLQSMPEKEKAVAGRAPRIDDSDDSDVENDVALKELTAFRQRRASGKRRIAEDLDDEEKKPTSHNAQSSGMKPKKPPSEHRRGFAQGIVRKPTEILEHYEEPALKNTKKEPRKVRAGIPIQNAGVEEVRPGIPIQNAGGNEVRPSIPIPITAHTVFPKIPRMNAGGNEVRPSIPIPETAGNVRPGILRKEGTSKKNGRKQVGIAKAKVPRAMGARSRSLPEP
jgi:hypothetical protein